MSATPTARRTLVLAALGIVFGDIGTSPLYAIKECFKMKDGVVTAHAIAVTESNVLGVLSLVFWSLVVVISVKYLGAIMKADNRGEGGIFALLALVPAEHARRGMVLLALFGAALLYGDGVITPAISVLSAVEGLEVATSHARPLVLPLTVGILVGLFAVQKHGTAGIGAMFGPITLVWFGAIAMLGVRGIIEQPGVLAAVNPVHAWSFFQANGFRGFFVLGSVVLCITGGEALYADMGHFGRSPIRIGWYAIVFPSLLLNYFGQGAWLIAHGHDPRPFWALVPELLIIPTVILATAATVIASQALISGAFSLTRQAVQLGYLPRVTIVHTSDTNEGQIYIPEINKALAVACVLLVLAFKESDALAAAYGIAVTGTMGITSVVYYFVATRRWGWPVRKALPLVTLFLAFDLAFFGSNALKFFDGGWFPIALAVSIFILMTTWKLGRQLLGARFAATMMPLDTLLDDFDNKAPQRVPGIAVFMSGSAEGTPPVLLHHLKHNKVVHDQVVLLSILPSDSPTVTDAERMVVMPQRHGFFRLVAKFGFMETPNVPALLKRAGFTDAGAISYYLGRETLLINGKSKMGRWRKGVFAFVSRNALPATSYFGIPPGRVVELGMQVEL